MRQQIDTQGLHHTCKTVHTKVIHRQPHNSNLLEERVDDIQLDTP